MCSCRRSRLRAAAPGVRASAAAATAFASRRGPGRPGRTPPPRVRGGADGRRPRPRQAVAPRRARLRGILRRECLRVRLPARPPCGGGGLRGRGLVSKWPVCVAGRGREQGDDGGGAASGVGLRTRLRHHRRGALRGMAVPGEPMKPGSSQDLSTDCR